MTGEWFVIKTGPNAGRWHMAGWMGDARRTMPTLPGEESGWLAWENCPRCGAMVCGGDAPMLGTCVWAHEDWHHQTDHPHPEVTPEQLTDLLFRTGPGGMTDSQIKAVNEAARQLAKAGREELAARKEIREMRGA